MKTYKLSVCDEAREILLNINEYKPLSTHIADAAKAIAKHQNVDWLKIYAMSPSDFNVAADAPFNTKRLNVVLSAAETIIFESLYRSVQASFPSITIRGAYSSVVIRLITRAYALEIDNKLPLV